MTRQAGTIVSARRACKPDSVPRCISAPGSMTIPLDPPLPAGSSCQPGSPGQGGPAAVSVARPDPREIPIRHCSRWGLPCRSGCPSRGGLLPHRFTLAAGTPAVVCFLWRFPSGCPGRALPGTVALWSPDFPRGPEGPRGHPALRAQRGLDRMRAAGQRPSIAGGAGGGRCPPSAGGRFPPEFFWPDEGGGRMKQWVAACRRRRGLRKWRWTRAVPCVIIALQGRAKRCASSSSSSTTAASA